MKSLRDALLSLPKRALLRVMNVYPPYLGAGVRVVDVEGQGDDVDALTVELKLTALNRNYLGTAFGGSLYAMTDPWFVLLMVWRLGPGYVVWDKAAHIDFISPGRGPVRARFALSQAQVDAVREAVQREGRVRPVYEVEVVDLRGQLVARVQKTLSVKRASVG